MLKFKAEERLTYKALTWFKIDKRKSYRTLGIKNGYLEKLYLP